MLDKQQTEKLRPNIKTLNIICGAMIVGVMVVTGVMFLLKAPPKINQLLDVLVIIGLVFAASAYFASFVVPTLIRKAALEQDAKDNSEKSKDESGLVKRMFGIFQSSMIIKYALLEGAMFANLMFWFITGSVFNLIALAVGLFLMVVEFPTEGKVVTSVETMLDNAKLDKRL